jgi:hypothetical protein
VSDPKDRVGLKERAMAEHFYPDGDPLFTEDKDPLFTEDEDPRKASERKAEYSFFLCVEALSEAHADELAHRLTEMGLSGSVGQRKIEWSAERERYNVTGVQTLHHFNGLVHKERN